jgi:hypothetical protein
MNFGGIKIVIVIPAKAGICVSPTLYVSEIVPKQRCPLSWA